MKTIITIPAKSHSSRIPNKNMTDLGGKPLIVWTLEAIKLWPVPIDKIIVVTDGKEIASCAKQYDAEIFDLTNEVSKFNNHQLWKYISSVNEDAVHILMEITSPFRCDDEMIAAWNLYQTNQFDVIVGVIKIKFWLFDESGKPENILDTEKLSQNIKPRYHPTGNFHISNSTYLRSCKYLFEGRIGMAEVGLTSALDIDYPCELEWARRHIAKISQGNTV